MPQKKEQSCPRCESGFISAIMWWKPVNMKGGFIDAFHCHDCNMTWEAGDDKELPKNWTPKITHLTGKKNTVATGQISLTGKIHNIREVINPVPIMVRSPSGNWLTIYKAPSRSPKQYINELDKMSKEMQRHSKTWKVPFWYKYRTIHRPNERVHVELVKAQIGKTDDEQWSYVEKLYSEKEDVKIKDTGYFYQVSYRKSK